MLHPCLTLIFILNYFGILLQHTHSLHRLFLPFPQSFLGLHMLYAFTMGRVKCLFKIYEIQIKCCLPLINLLSDVMCINAVVQFNPWCNFHFRLVQTHYHINYHTPMTELLQTIPHPQAQRPGLVPVVAWGDGNRSNWTMHYLHIFFPRLWCRSSESLP